LCSASTNLVTQTEQIALRLPDGTCFLRDRGCTTHDTFDKHRVIRYLGDGAQGSNGVWC